MKLKKNDSVNGMGIGDNIQKTGKKFPKFGKKKTEVVMPVLEGIEEVVVTEETVTEHADELLELVPNT